MKKINLGIIGLGKIAEKHLDVIDKIKSFKIYSINSKTNKNSNYFKKKYKVKKIFKSYTEMIDDEYIDAILVLLPADQSYKIIEKLIIRKKIFFTEKPISLNYKKAKHLYNLSKKNKSINMVGHNRRFYSIFHKGIALIKKHGALNGVFIEGHERIWKLKDKLSKTFLNNWLYLNSTHTIDLLRFFGGEYSKIYTLSNIKKNKKEFSLIYKSQKNILCTYISNWNSPGGWSIKLLGNNITVVFEPLESGYWVNNKFKIFKIHPSKNDLKFKPGFYNQMLSFKKMVITKKIEWPAEGIEESFRTTQIIKKLKENV